MFQLTSGLSIYESVFNNQCGVRGVIGGPHEIFTKIHQSYFNQLPWIPQRAVFILQNGNQSQPRYRPFVSSKHQEEVSIKEEVEQHLIDSSMKIDPQTNTITATLPFIADPITHLSPNKDIALKIYYQQLRKLNNAPSDKADIIASESKLHKLGFVDFVDNLTQKQQSMLRDSPIQNFIPWRVVWKASSVTTPCRIVFDGSHPTSTGFSLNDLLAKGRNNLNKLQKVLIRWSTHPIGIHTDIQKMYNTIRLHENHWCYQRYIWEENLDPSKIPREKVIETLIYGIKPSGNQSEHGLRTITSSFKDQYPQVDQIIQNDIYVDDCITGKLTTAEAHQRADEIEFVLSHGNFNLKGFTFSGSHPPENLLDNGITIIVGGMTWYPKSDELSINISEMNFSKKCRGKKPTKTANIIPERLTNDIALQKSPKFSTSPDELLQSLQISNSTFINSQLESSTGMTRFLTNFDHFG